MNGLTLVIDDRGVQALIQGIGDRLARKETVLRSIGAIARESVRSNFAAGGRPGKWPGLKHRQGQPLRDTGRLQNSITAEIAGNVVHVGTNVEYAAVHHFGARRGEFGQVVAKVKGYTRGNGVSVRPHTRTQAVPWGNIPARPFLLLQEEDKLSIQAVLADYIMEGKT